jgi:hypothetical protein
MDPTRSRSSSVARGVSKELTIATIDASLDGFPTTTTTTTMMMEIIDLTRLV